METLIEKDGADHVAGSTGQDEGGIKGLSWWGKEFQHWDLLFVVFKIELRPLLLPGKPSPTEL